MPELPTSIGAQAIKEKFIFNVEFRHQEQTAVGEILDHRPQLARLFGPSHRAVAMALLFALFASLPQTSWGARDRDPQCVPFARALSNIRLFGDAWRWWSAAAGLYDRGTTPRAGSVLSFQSDLRMPLGHIAIVTKVISRREIEVDHANWAWGAVRREVRVLDVSAGNDWTAVRVELSERDHFGAVYGTNGFIYGWPIELGPQIIHIAATLRAFQDDRSRHIDGILPIVVGPRGATTDNFPDRALPIVIFGRHQTR